MRSTVDMFVLVTFWSFVVAVYAVFPEKIRSKVHLFVGTSFTLIYFAVTSLIAIVINTNFNISSLNEAYFTKLVQIPFFYGLIENLRVIAQIPNIFSVIIYIILVLYVLAVGIDISTGKINRGNIKKVNSYFEDLYRKDLGTNQRNDNWVLLIDSLYENCKHIVDVANNHIWYRKLFYKLLFAIIPDMEPRIIITNYGESEVEVSETSKINEFINIVRNKYENTIERLIYKLTGNRYFYKNIPLDKSSSKANDIFSKYILDKKILELSINYKPEYIPLIISCVKAYNYRIKETIEITIKTLYQNLQSLLYTELFNNSSPNDSSRIDTTRTILLDTLFDGNFIDKCEIAVPIQASMDTYFDKLYYAKDDINNYPNFNMYGDDRLKSPIYLTIVFYEWMLKIALARNIHWHLFVMNFQFWFKKMVENINFNIKGIDIDREFPNAYFYFMYETQELFRDIFRYIENSSELELPSVKKPDNASIPYWVLETFVDCIVALAEAGADKIPESKKNYLTEMLWWQYFELKKTKCKQLEGYGDVLWNLIKEKLTGRYTGFNYKLFKVLFTSFNMLDYPKFAIEQPDDYKEMDLKLKGYLENYVIEKLNMSSIELYLQSVNEYVSNRANLGADGIYIPNYWKTAKVIDESHYKSLIR